ncbi:uncharacterized protein LOC115225213 [Octopus sinensis]|uniref:Uncharacterized protein LOC115225213 n=1 Tax=Octopus sinensis TaxID=2607531 RepID=A0A7E6FR44_9MOLL|nr:uncharacterized protein LOC115225213 [Octopus sinensis]
MKILAMSRTDHEAASEAYYQYVVGPNTDVTLFFDKRLFSRKRGSQVPLWAQAITVKKPQARTDKELDSLDELMMTVRSYREKFQCTMRKSVCQVFRYTNCERGRIVLRQNHRGVGFYLVYSGSLYVQKELEEKTGNKHLENIIRSGQHFGEVALLGDGLRTATVICREPSELFYIEKDDFAALCPQLFDDELSQKIKFAQRFELFKDWRDLNLHKLCLQSQVLYISHGQIIEADWLQTRYLYFVMQGCISLLKKFQVQQSVKRRHSPVHSAKHAKGRQEEEEEQRQEQEDAKWYTCVAVVGHLHSGDHSDLSVLEQEDRVSGVSMKSDGVRVLRFSTRNTFAFSEGNCIQKFLQKYKKPKIPSDEELCKNYHNSSKWNKFKKQMLYTQLLQKNGAAVTPATATSATSGH